MIFIPLSLESVASGVREAAGSLIGDLSSGALAIAALLFVYILLQVCMKLFNGSPFPWSDILKPFVIVMVISLWPNLLNTMDTVGEFMQESIVEGLNTVDNEREVSKKVAENETLVVKYEDELTKEDEMEMEKDPDNNASSRRGIWGILSSLKKGVKVTFVAGVSQLNPLRPLFSLIYSITKGVMIVLAQMYLILLGMLGPFAFAFSIIPSMNRLSTWLGSYLQYFLWAPLVSVIHSLVTLFGASYKEPVFSSGFIDKAGTIAESIGSVSDALDYLWFNSLASIVGVCLFFSIPKLCRLIVSSAEDVIGSSVSRTIMSAGQMASKTLGVGV